MIIYTDGGALNNGYHNAVAGWAFLVLNQTEDDLDEVSPYSDSGVILRGTNNIGELTAIIKALEYLKSVDKDGEHNIYSDSSYCLTGIQQWVKGWKKNGWYRDAKQTKEVKNLDLWKRLDKLNGELNIGWHKVAGHSGDKWNDHVDKMVTRAMRSVEEGEE